MITAGQQQRDGQGAEQGDSECGVETDHAPKLAQTKRTFSAGE